MPTQNFNWSGPGETPLETTPITAAAGNFARLRFSEFGGRGRLFIIITANGMATEEEVPATQHWASGALQDGDSVKIKFVPDVQGFGKVAGILEVAN